MSLPDFQPILTGPNVVVRPITTGDWPELFAVGSDPKMHRSRVFIRQITISNHPGAVARNDREAIGKFGQSDVVDGCGRNGAAAAVRQVARGTALRIDGDAKAEIERRARCR
jgi:hypothetical protein